MSGRPLNTPPDGRGGSFPRSGANRRGTPTPVLVCLNRPGTFARAGHTHTVGVSRPHRVIVALVATGAFRGAVPP